MAKKPGAQPGDKRRLGHRMPRKKCVNCKKTKAVSAFPKRGGLTYENLLPADPRRYDSQCKLCKKPVPAGKKRSTLKEPVRAYKKKRPYRPRTDGDRQTRGEYNAKVRAHTRVKSMLYLALHGCEECGERDPRKLEYDHRNPSNKKRTISRLITEAYSWSSNVLRREIRKCRILCANCHRVHTVKQQGYYADESVAEALRAIAKKYKFHL